MAKFAPGASLPRFRIDTGAGFSDSRCPVVGDLTVSLLKREMGIKDTGSWLPAMGGVLDRLDSICGAAPILLSDSCWWGIDRCEVWRCWVRRALSGSYIRCDATPPERYRVVVVLGESISR